MSKRLTNTKATAAKSNGSPPKLPRTPATSSMSAAVNTRKVRSY